MRLPILLAVVLVPGTARAATFIVPDDAPTIQIAINLASDTDEIVVRPGEYFETLDMAGKAVTLRSMNGPDVTTINAFGQSDSVIHCITGEGADTVISGFTLREGDATGGPNDRGGGIYANASSPTITECIFVDNAAIAGGAFYGNGSSATLTDCEFRLNFASNGGALYFNQSNATISRCVFDGNESAAKGGAAFFHRGASSVADSSFTDNLSATYGGAISIQSSAQLAIDRCVFDGNVSDGGGDNGRGGALSGHDTSNTTVWNSLFVGNRALRFGGAIFGDVAMTIRSSSFSGNTGNQSVYGGNRVSTFRNCIIWGNGGSPLNVNARVDYSDVEGGYAGPGNIDADPMFADADLRILPGSPVIDAGDTSLITGSYPVDYDGERRAVDDPDMPDTGVTVLNLSVDMGAYELQVEGSPDSCPSDLDDSGAIDFGDLLRILTDWGPCPE